MEIGQLAGARTMGSEASIRREDRLLRRWSNLLGVPAVAPADKTIPIRRDEVRISSSRFGCGGIGLTSYAASTQSTKRSDRSRSGHRLLEWVVVGALRYWISLPDSGITHQLTDLRCVQSFES